MADYDDLMFQAQALGEALARHPRVGKFMTARQAVDANAASRELLKQYSTHMQRLQQLSASQQPIEVADKQKARELEGQLTGDQNIKEFMRAQADYLELMHRINEAMEAPVAAAAQPRPNA